MPDLSGVINHMSVNQIIDAIFNADLNKEELAQLISTLEAMLGKKLVNEHMGRV